MEQPPESKIYNLLVESQSRDDFCHDVSEIQAEFLPDLPENILSETCISFAFYDFSDGTPININDFIEINSLNFNPTDFTAALRFLSEDNLVEITSTNEFTVNNDFWQNLCNKFRLG